MNNVPDAKIEKPTDVLVKITTTNICGSDLHMYEGRTSVEKGKIFGHENMGVVIEAGNAVERVKVGDRVCLPFNIACGFCENCERGWTGFCLTANPGNAGAAYGYASMKLEGLDRHHRLIDSYKKLHAARANAVAVAG